MLESLFSKVTGFQPRNFIKKRLQHRCFPVKFATFLRRPFLQNTSGGCFQNKDSLSKCEQIHSFGSYLVLVASYKLIAATCILLASSYLSLVTNSFLLVTKLINYLLITENTTSERFFS